MSSVHLLLNPRRQRETDGEIRRAIEARGHSVVELRPPSPDAIATTITEARHAGVTRLVIAGGDGLIHHALPAIAGSDVCVGIVAQGTGNDFARALGLPTRIDEAVEAALAEPTGIDLISSSTGQWAASVMTGGFSGQVNERANRMSFPKGQQRYTVATALELPRLRPSALQLTVDDEVHIVPTCLFAVANTRFFGGGMAICPNAVPSDGLLDVTVIGDASRREFAKVLPTVFTGAHLDHPAVTVYRGRRVEIRTAVDLWADGERFVAGGGELTTSFLATPGALRVAGTLVGT